VGEQSCRRPTRRLTRELLDVMPHVDTGRVADGGVPFARHEDTLWAIVRYRNNGPTRLAVEVIHPFGSPAAADRYASAHHIADYGVLPAAFPCCLPRGD
jgi:hypothetical protein